MKKIEGPFRSRKIINSDEAFALLHKAELVRYEDLKGYYIHGGAYFYYVGSINGNDYYEEVPKPVDDFGEMSFE